jgi:hypothetical protein
VSSDNGLKVSREYEEALKVCVEALYEAVHIAPLDRLPSKAGTAIQHAQYVLDKYAGKPETPGTVDIEEYNKHREYRKKLNALSLYDIDLPGVEIDPKLLDELHFTGLDTHTCTGVVIDSIIVPEE